jgi:hypothetical protein
MRLWWLLAADVCFTNRRQPVAAFVATSEHGGNRDQQGDAAKARDLRAYRSLCHRLHEPSQVGAPITPAYLRADFLTDFRRM